MEVVPAVTGQVAYFIIGMEVFLTYYTKFLMDVFTWVKDVNRQLADILDLAILRLRFRSSLFAKTASCIRQK